MLRVWMILPIFTANIIHMYIKKRKYIMHRQTWVTSGILQPRPEQSRASFWGAQEPSCAKIFRQLPCLGS